MTQGGFSKSALHILTIDLPCRIDLLQAFEALAERPDTKAALITTQAPHNW
jgi:hypothetical protein